MDLGGTLQEELCRVVRSAGDDQVVVAKFGASDASGYVDFFAGPHDQEP
jgi:hypothetical protein